MRNYRIADKFSKTPGPRYIRQGDFSGELFRDKFLMPVFDDAVSKKERLLIDLDGGYGYFVSFLEESFGGLARIKGIQIVLDTLQFKSDDEPSLIEDIISYIKEANSKKGNPGDGK